MSKTTNKFAPEVRERAVRMVFDHERDHPSRWAAATIERAERAMSELGTGVPFLIVYYGSDGSGGWQPLDRPLRTITTIDRFGLVTWDGGTPMLRMLQVPELRRGMGLGNDFVEGTDLPRRERIRPLGNGVAPPVMARIIETMLTDQSTRMPSRIGGQQWPGTTDRQMEMLLTA